MALEVKTIEIKEGKKVHLIELNRIVYFEASGKNTIVHFIDKTTILSTKMLKHYHELLHTKGFFRVHRKYLINMEHIIFHSKDGRIPDFHTAPFAN